MEGEEDCLFLDVIVPGGVNHSETGKAVMVWIHGGGYLSGHRLQYPATPLAVRGDVIVVTINYRLGILGFLSNGTGECHSAYLGMLNCVFTLDKHCQVPVTTDSGIRKWL